MTTPARFLPRLATRTAFRYTRVSSLRPATAQPIQPRHAFSTSIALRTPYSSSDTQVSPEPPARTAPSLLEFDLTNHTILVTGAARGLGLCMAQSLLEAGATVYALDRLPPSEQSPEFSKLQSRPSQHFNNSLHYCQIDVRDVSALNEAIASIADAEGRMDGLITAAGIQQETPAIEYSQDDARRMFEVNAVGVMMTAQAVAKQMIRFGKGGSMAFIASMSGTVANRGLPCSVYNSSKAAVVQLARNLASEWGGKGIRVNTVSPGYIVTQMVEELFEKHPERREAWAGQNMLGRLSMPEDYRAVAVYLMGSGSRFMTATDLRIDGGHCAW